MDLKNQSKADNNSQKSIRLKAGIIIVIIQWILWFVIPKFTTSGMAMAISVFGGFLGGIAVFLWWNFFSRASKTDRWIASIFTVLFLAIFPFLCHESIAKGLAGLMYFFYAIPVLSIAFVFWAVVSRNFSVRLQRLSMIVTIVLINGVWLLLKTDGLSATGSAHFLWRWDDSRIALDESKSGEIEDELPLSKSKAQWPGFRGSKRNSIVSGVKIKTDWKQTAPVEIWRKPIGSACSSFAVRGSFFYTQEQREELEMVTCYNLITGDLVWAHADTAKFWDSHCGPGPKSTPTLVDSCVFTVGATGILNALNAVNGSLLWNRNIAKDTETKDSGWGFSSSPLVFGNVVYVAATGRLVAYNKVNGDIIWMGPEGGDAYSSPQLFTINGVDQIVLTNALGIKSFYPANGEILWEFSSPADTRIVQPALFSNSILLLSAGNKRGLHKLKIKNEDGNWNVSEIWKSNKLRPDFNDFVVHEKYIYGIDGMSLACIDLKKGERKWRQGRYGGQILLLAEQNILLVLTEKGEVVLVKADPEKFEELARMQAIEGKTWNHPVIVKQTLLLRNAKEMVAYQL